MQSSWSKYASQRQKRKAPPKGERKYTATVIAKKMATLAAGQEVSPLKAGREQEADSEEGGGEEAMDWLAGDGEEADDEEEEEGEDEVEEEDEAMELDE